MPLLLLLAGCVSTVYFPPPLDWDTSDTATPEFPQVRITSATVTCDPEAGTWLWQAETDGWTRSVALDVIDTSEPNGWEEQHDLDLVESHPEGRWDHLALGPIPGGTPAETWEPNTSTVFDCSTDRSKLTFAIRVWNHLGDLNDCIVWGHDAAGVASRMSTDPEVAESGDCLVLSNTNGSPP